jgi:hypothetical protein
MFLRKLILIFKKFSKHTSAEKSLERPAGQIEKPALEYTITHYSYVRLFPFPLRYEKKTFRKFCFVVGKIGRLIFFIEEKN